MPELNKALDKLRDKTLSFGCMTSSGYRLVGESEIYIPGGSICGGEYFVESEIVGTYWILEGEYADTIIGHPLTYGRIMYLNHIRMDTQEPKVWLSETVFDKITNIFFMYRDLQPQTEVERMKHEKRPELEKLLISFAALLPTTTTNE